MNTRDDAYSQHDPVLALTTDGYFSFASYKARFFWDDDYFSRPGFVYHPSLATMSMALSMSAFVESSNDLSTPTQNDVSLLNQIGFYHIETYHSLDNAINILTAHRDIAVNDKHYTLLMVNIQSEIHGPVISADFSPSQTRYHEEFRQVAEAGLSFLVAYINRNQHCFREDIKIWITGFSRGGAVANLMAAWILMAEEIAGVPVNNRHIYAYTFNAPRVVQTNNIYRLNEGYNFSIHNVLIPADLVTWVASPALGFVRYGADRILPERGLISGPFAFDNMMEFFIALDTARVRDALIYENGRLKHRMELFRTVSLGPNAARRYTQQPIPIFMYELTNHLAAIAANRNQYVAEWSLIYAILDTASRYDHDSYLTTKIESVFDGDVLDAMLTLAHNREILATLHHPELMLAWLMSQDPKHGGYFREFPPMHRVVYFGGPADIRIRENDDDGKLVAHFIDGVVQDVGSHILTAIGQAGEMRVYLPIDITYHWRLTPLEDGLFPYAIYRFSLLHLGYYQVKRWDDSPFYRRAAGFWGTGNLPAGPDYGLRYIPYDYRIW